MADVLNLLSFQTFTNADYTEDRNPDSVWPAQTPRLTETVALPDSNDSLHALPHSDSQDKLYLARACGNCARAYGTPLVCAALNEPITALTCCDAYSSPFSIP